MSLIVARNHREKVMTDIDTGDSVIHRPTGETWLVAHVDGDRLYWCGWPPGCAALSDCTLVEKATPEARDKLIRDLAAMRPDNRSGYDARQAFAAYRLSDNQSSEHADGA